MTQRSEVPTWAQPGAKKASKAQIKWIKDMAETKQFPDQATEDRLWKALRIWEDPEEIGITMPQASKIIDWLKAQPNKAQDPQHHDVSHKDMHPVPAGRYAVENTEGELRFYHVWRPQSNPDVVCLYVLHGPDQSRIRGKAMVSILDKIKDAGVEKAMIRYGHEIGSCSRCGRRLTNRVSRELGIGPICGGRLFEDFGSKVSAARQAIIDRGEDPDEEVTSEGWPPVEQAEHLPHQGQPGDGCDRCGKSAELYYNTATGLALCERCDMEA